VNTLLKRHPLLFVLLVAILLRLPAVLFSKGYMASDDHFETVRLAYNWVRTTPWYEDGLRLWPERPADTQTRYPLYVFTLYTVMKGCLALGIDDLDGMTYAIRALHALISLLSVWALFEIVLALTRSRPWAIAAGLAAAAYFGMPFLAVRTLIEVVGGHFWTVALLMLYRYDARRRNRWLVWAALWTGLAWLVRFEIAFAALPVPLLLWYRYRDPAPGSRYALWTLGIVLAASFAEIFLVNGFAASSLAHISQVLTESPPYQTRLLVYGLVVLGLFIPPFSLLVVYLWSNRTAAREHAILWGSTLFFIFMHTLSPSRQERYLLPVLPAMILMTVIALWYHVRANGWLVRHWKWGRGILTAFVTINFILLVPFTISYRHRGLVEPFVQIEQLAEKPAPIVLLVSPDNGRLYPHEYGGLKKIEYYFLNSWEGMSMFQHHPELVSDLDYAVIYPPAESALAIYRDSIEQHTGPMHPVAHVRPSIIDYLAHWVNPQYNPSHEAYLFTPERKLKTDR